mmetsp:Transcript_12067/g.13882  ORF Transcript_12067/g.13882 Transcript_12067/m.13882 type:complete len:148 (+) Transcript_12067:43-486(+)
MPSLQSFEVEVLIAPAFVIFMMFIIPIPFLSKLISRMVLKLESISISGISVLFVLTVVTLILFVNQVYTTAKKYGSGNPAPEFVDLAAKLEHQGKKWKAERDLYIHAISFVLLASVMKFARLIRDENKAVKAASSLASIQRDEKKSQ